MNKRRIIPLSKIYNKVKKAKDKLIEDEKQPKKPKHFKGEIIGYLCDDGSPIFAK